MNIPLASPEIHQNDIDEVVRVLQSGKLSMGPEVEKFEKKLAQKVGCKYAVAVCNGTAALHLIVKALGIRAGDEIITTPYSFVASANAALFEHAKPIFVDIDKKTYNIDVAQVEKHVTARTKAILAVDVFGRPADWEKLSEIAKQYRLHLIDDCCEALGSKGILKHTSAGAFGFYPNKQITSGEGGAIVTNDENIAKLAMSYRNQGRNVGTLEMVHERLGYNYRLSDIQCAMLSSQLDRLDHIKNSRAQIVTWYQEFLGATNVRLPMSEHNQDICWFVYVIELPPTMNAQHKYLLIKKLRERGIGSSDYFPAIHLQPLYQKLYGLKAGDFPNAEFVSDRTIALPFYNQMTKSEVERVSKNVIELLQTMNA